jgi:hypothetical protein
VECKIELFKLTLPLGSLELKLDRYVILEAFENMLSDDLINLVLNFPFNMFAHVVDYLVLQEVFEDILDFADAVHVFLALMEHLFPKASDLLLRADLTKQADL